MSYCLLVTATDTKNIVNYEMRRVAPTEFMFAIFLLGLLGVASSIIMAVVLKVLGLTPKDEKALDPDQPASLTIGAIIKEKKNQKQKNKETYNIHTPF